MSEPIHINAAVLRDVADSHDRVADEIAAARSAGAEIAAAVDSYGPIMHQVKAAVADVLSEREAALLEHDNRHRMAAEELRRQARNYIDTDEANAGRLQL
jgi:Excreted virulence factor EspC, type VII ESX diderm